MPDLVAWFSKPASDFDPETSSVLLNCVFRILRAAGIEILLVEKVADAGRHVQVFSDRVPQQREVEYLITAQGILQQRQASAEKLPFDSRRQRSGRSEGQSDSTSPSGRGVIQRRVPDSVVICVHIIEAGLALQAVAGASAELNIHSCGLRISGILVLEVSVAGNRDECNQVASIRLRYTPLES